ncbi:DNA polymerase III subunit delta' [Agitococcus lubricus]|nr:DNA polymerase III subunit delta' [Agitococcus lubricus]
MTMPIVYPWQQAPWQSLLKRRSGQGLAHAFLMSGVAGVGKQHFVNALSAWLLCQQPDPAHGACGRCKSCQLWQAESHPDYRLVQAQTDEKTGKVSKVIKVEQVRELIEFLNKSPQLNGYRVAVIAAADTLNSNAANSLLKTLEEPGEKTAIFLITEQAQAILPTLRSRCQHLTLTAPNTQQALAWLMPQLTQPEQAPLLLALTENAPLAALALTQQAGFTIRQPLAQHLLAVRQKKQSSLQIAQHWQKQAKPEDMFWAMQLLLSDVLLLSLGQASAIKNRDLLPIMTEIAANSTSVALNQWHQYCSEAMRLLSANIQPALLIDNFWQQLAS